MKDINSFKSGVVPGPSAITGKLENATAVDPACCKRLNKGITDLAISVKCIQWRVHLPEIGCDRKGILPLHNMYVRIALDFLGFAFTY